MFENLKYNYELNQYTIFVKENLYPLSILMKTAYMFIDNFYIYFDYEKKGLIKIILKSKNKITSKKFKITIGNFYNELIFQYLRLDIFTNTKNLREIIVGRALYGTSLDLSNYENMNNKPDSIEFFNDKDIHLKEAEDYQVDPYDIASDWFENLDKEN